MLNAEEGVRLGGAVLDARYPTADAGFVAGSIIRDEATTLSDLDLVVLCARVANARRESFSFEGVRVEAFIHDSETLLWILQADLGAGRAAHINMIAEARIVGPRLEKARAWQARAQAMLIAGPPPLEAAELDRLRYHISDRIDDLRDPRGRAETIAIGTWLYAPMAEFILRSRGVWAATAKWIPRQLRALDARLEAEFSDAFDALFANNNPAPLIGFAEKALAPFGGFLFDGYESQSPPSARIAET